MTKGLPLFVSKVETDAQGIERISLVKYPAIERGFVAFGAQKPIKFRINEVQHKVMGPIMIPDLPIYRRDESGEYYIQYPCETIEVMMRKFLRDGSRVNIEHFMPVTGVDLQELFLKDSTRGISPKNYDDLPDGTLFGTFYVSNTEVWDQILKGEVTGFSLEGWFAHDELSAANEQVEASQLFNQIKCL